MWCLYTRKTQYLSRNLIFQRLELFLLFPVLLDFLFFSINYSNLTDNIIRFPRIDYWSRPWFVTLGYASRSLWELKTIEAHTRWVSLGKLPWLFPSISFQLIEAAAVVDDLPVWVVPGLVIFDELLSFYLLKVRNCLLLNDFKSINIFITLFHLIIFIRTIWGWRAQCLIYL